MWKQEHVSEKVVISDAGLLLKAGERCAACVSFLVKGMMIAMGGASKGADMKTIAPGSPGRMGSGEETRACQQLCLWCRGLFSVRGGACWHVFQILFLGHANEAATLNGWPIQPFEGMATNTLRKNKELDTQFCLLANLA